MSTDHKDIQNDKKHFRPGHIHNRIWHVPHAITIIILKPKGGGRLLAVDLVEDVKVGHHPVPLDTTIVVALGDLARVPANSTPVELLKRTERPTSYRSVQRADEVEDLAPDGQVRLLPPDRPTRLCRLNYRDKVDIEQPAPFVARCARAEFAYHDAYLD